MWPDEGFATWAPRPTTPDITANDLRTRLYQISDDSMQGRRIGELGNFKTTAYIASEFKRLGLKPAGENGGYFQDLPYGAMRVDSTVARLIAAGGPAVAGTEWIPAPAAAASRIVGDANVTDAGSVFAGRWGDTTTALDANAIRGKVAVFTYTPPGGRGGAGGGRGGFGTVRDPRAASAGAALILVTGPDSARGIGASAFASRPGMRPVASVTGAPAAAISGSLATKIFGQPMSQLSMGATGAPVSATWTDIFTPSKYTARNVIAILPGSDPARAGEYVLLSAHNDHVGMLPRPVDLDSVPRIQPRDHAAAGRERPTRAADRRPAEADRLADRLRALDPAAAPRLGEQRSRR